MKNSKIIFFALITIVIFTFIIRSYNLSSVPPGLFCDEAERGVSAYSLIKTGRDWHGEQFPLFFESLGDYTPPLQTYSMILPTALLGMNESSVRITSVLWGTAAVLVLFYLGRLLFSPKVGLLASFFFSIQPWALHYSRFGVEFMVYVTLFLLALTLSLASLKNKKNWLFASLVWGLTLYTYQPAKLITPLFLISFLAINQAQIKTNKNYFTRGLLIFISVSLPFFFHMISGEGFYRFQQVSFFSTDKPMVEKLELFANRYLIQFSPTFLWEGEPTFISRHFTQGLTPLLFFQALLVPLGIIYLLRHQKNKKVFFIFLVWALIYPVGGALTASGPLSSRSVIGAPLFALLSGCGMFLVFKLIRSHFKSLRLGTIALVLLFLIVVVNFFSFYFFYLNEYPQKSADFWGWQYGPREIISYFTKVESQYDELIMSDQFNAPAIFLKFYAPEGCQRCKIGNIDSYDSNKKQLFALPPSELQDKSYNTKRIIYYPDNKIAFKIVEFDYDQ